MKKDISTGDLLSVQLKCTGKYPEDNRVTVIVGEEFLSISGLVSKMIFPSLLSIGKCEGKTKTLK